jgi:hypothetical protein
MEKITRAKTCQNCQHGLFGKKNGEFFGGGRKVTGICSLYQDSPMPMQFHYNYYVSTWGEVYKKFKDARSIEELPTWKEFVQAYFSRTRNTINQQSEETIRGWYDGSIAWCSWWIRNWNTVAERRIDRTTVCDGWDGTQTSKFYKAPKTKK